METIYFKLGGHENDKYITVYCKDALCTDIICIDRGYTNRIKDHITIIDGVYYNAVMADK